MQSFSQKSLLLYLQSTRSGELLLQPLHVNAVALKDPLPLACAAHHYLGMWKLQGVCGMRCEAHNYILWKPTAQSLLGGQSAIAGNLKCRNKKFNPHHAKQMVEPSMFGSDVFWLCSFGCAAGKHFLRYWFLCCYQRLQSTCTRYAPCCNFQAFSRALSNI